MKKEKVTMKDIAKEVNVSLATVSYVLNHSEKEKISHDTRIKVLETAKRMGYIPNLAARSLANKKSNLIGIIINMDTKASTCKKYQYYDLACELQAQIYNLGYDTILSIGYEQDNIEILYKNSLEAIFIIDIDEKKLKKLTNKFYVPIIFIDCLVEEGLFYRIIPDYLDMIKRAKQILEEENPYLIMDDIINENIKNIITGEFKSENIFLNNKEANLIGFLNKNMNRKGIIIGDLLASQIERYVDNKKIVVLSESSATDILLPNTKKVTVSNKRKAEVAVSILNQLIKLNYDDNGCTKILLPVE